MLSLWASAPAGTQHRPMPGQSQHSSEGTGTSPALWTMQSQSSFDFLSPALGTKGTPTAWPVGHGCWVVRATEQGTGPTSLLAAIRRPRAAAAVLCRCECRRYQRWMVTAARFTCWMNLWGQGGRVSTAPRAAEHRGLPHSTGTCRCTEVAYPQCEIPQDKNKLPWSSPHLLTSSSCPFPHLSASSSVTSLLRGTLLLLLLWVMMLLLEKFF